MLELASIVILGIFAQWLAWRFKVPAILPLILVGLAVGPFSTFWTEDHSKWLSPIYNGKHGLFPGDNLFYFVELSIGIILFEGGLTLKRSEIKEIGPIILKLISLGSLVTFVFGALAAHFIVDLSWPLSFLFSGLIIVTGPTVIAPILRNIPLKKDVANILKWEGILIDPIGALVAVLVYEFLSSLATGGHGHVHADGGHGDGSFTTEAFKHFITLTLVGFSLGTIAAYALREVIKRHWVPHYLLNVFTLAAVLAVFVGSGLLVPDSGLLTIVVMGTVLANIELPSMDEILYFKESLAIMLISMLFILLAANINMSDLELLLDWRVALLFLAIILVIRPLGVFWSTHNCSLNKNEKLFISWVGPRGIVAAGIASLFGNKLIEKNAAALESGISIPFPGAEMITPLVFMIVLGTVLLNATTAGLVARVLGVLVSKSNGILIIGATKASRIVASYVQKQNIPVALIDNNHAHIEAAGREGLAAFQANIYVDDIRDNVELNSMGYLMAMTGSSAVNRYAISKLEEFYGEFGAYRLISSEERNRDEASPNNGLFSDSDDYINFSEIVRDHSQVHEMELTVKRDALQTIEWIRNESESIPLFCKTGGGELIIISTDMSTQNLDDVVAVAYIGKAIEVEEPTPEPIEEAE